MIVLQVAQSTTHGSECLAPRTCVHQIIDLIIILRYLRVPMLGRRQMFDGGGDGGEEVGKGRWIFFFDTVDDLVT